ATRDAAYPAPGEYFYPPLGLWLFRPLAAIPMPVLSLVWLALKLLAIAGLTRICHRHFERLNPRAAIVLYFVFAYSGALYRDLAAGNIAIFEQLGLWGAFVLLLRGRPLAFGVAIALIAQLKISPLFFLGLLLVDGPRPRWKELGLSLLVFAAVFASNFALAPALARSFVARLASGGGNLAEWGAFNPSSLALLANFSAILDRKGLPVQPWADELLWAIFAGTALAITSFVVVRARRRRPDLDVREVIYAACLLLCVIAPRMKDYTYTLALIPSLALLRRSLTRRKWPLEGFAVLASVGPTYVPVLKWLSRLYPYLPLFAAGLLLALHLRELSRPQPAPKR